MRRGKPPKAALTEHEMKIVKLIATGQTNREIAESFKISSKTVDTHRGNIMKFLGLRNNVELARHALRMGWVEL